MEDKNIFQYIQAILLIKHLSFFYVKIFLRMLRYFLAGFLDFILIIVGNSVCTNI